MTPLVLSAHRGTIDSQDLSEAIFGSGSLAPGPGAALEGSSLKRASRSSRREHWTKVH